jgi:rubrerythrin
MFVPFIIKRQEPPRIPDNIEELREIVNKKFEILEKQGGRMIGTTSEIFVKLRCPFCKSEFTGCVQEGCFHYRMQPTNCPVCGFPEVILKKLIALYKKQGIKWT